MRVDTNTAGHRQWFYFSASNSKKCRVTFHIYRFKKVYSLYQRGMQPYVRSRKQGGEWKPGGDSVFYRYETPLKQTQGKVKGRTFVLSFGYSFKHQNDQVFFAAGIPYTYSYLQKRLEICNQAIEQRGKLKIVASKLGQSMCGVDMQLLTIEHRLAGMLNECQKRRFIIINARTHSGQASCSWVLDGMLEQLSVSEQMESWLLRENIVFKIVPMLNPDGVMLGNYRTGIMGEDFNRKFNTGRRQFLPEIFHLKKVVSECKRQGKVIGFIDLHGHSVLKNSFIYGPSSQLSSKHELGNLPRHLADVSKYFSLNSCKFRNCMNLIETARMHFQVQYKILAFTCQNSLGLYHHQGQTFQMLSGDWQSFGKSTLHAMRMAWSERTMREQTKMESPRLKGKKSVQSPKKDRNLSPIKINLPEDDQIHSEAGSITVFSTRIEVGEKKLSLTDQGARLKKIANQRASFKIRRRSQIIKKPVCSIQTSPVKQLHTSEREIHVQEKPKEMPRAITFDNPRVLLKAIQKIREREETSSQGQSSKHSQGKYELFSVDEQNFSNDYVSINDIDSESEDLPAQQRANLEEYIIANNLQEQHEEQPSQKREQKELRELRQKDRRIRGAQAASKNSTREIKMTSVDDWGTLDDANTERKAVIKRKMDPHKFKDKAFRSLNNRPKRIHQESLVTISHQKKLVERQKDNSLRRQSLQKVDLRVNE